MNLSVFNGSLPKVGMRPTIDGRLGGVRESLEKQTMNMAKAAAKLISSSLYWGANHGAISYGLNGSNLITLASMLRIPVYMHNLSDEKILRPSSWTAFGTQCFESADYRAGSNFGPLYS
jgi:L-fucose isomerase-like protein